MTAPIRIATLSFAHYHAVFWSEVFRDLPQAEFVGIWDEVPVRGRKAAETYRTKYWDDLEALLAACDAVAVCSETLAHRSLIERASKHGCHVLCEKPPATTLEDCDAIAQAVSQAGVTFMQSFPKRFDPVNHELRDLLAREAFGRSGWCGCVIAISMASNHTSSTNGLSTRPRAAEVPCWMRVYTARISYVGCSVNPRRLARRFPERHWACPRRYGDCCVSLCEWSDRRAGVRLELRGGGQFD